MLRYLSLTWLAFLAACGPYPRGDWSGVFTNEKGRASALELQVGPRDRSSLLAYQPKRWRVYEVEGYAEGWFPFEGVFMRCVDGPCMVNVILAQDHLVEKSIEKYPQVPDGGIAIVGSLDDELMRECHIGTFGGRSWPVFAILDEASERQGEHTGVVALGVGCEFRPGRLGESGELVLEWVR